MSEPTPERAPATKKTAAAKRSAARTRPSTDTTPKEPAAPRSGLPKVGAFVTYDAADPLTGEKLTGVGVVIDAYSHGEGKNRISRVNVTRLSADLNLSADDVSAVGST